MGKTLIRILAALLLLILLALMVPSAAPVAIGEEPGDPVIAVCQR